jgi:hypothetical protein
MNTMAMFKKFALNIRKLEIAHFTYQNGFLIVNCPVVPPNPILLLSFFWLRFLKNLLVFSRNYSLKGKKARF